MKCPDCKGKGIIPNCYNCSRIRSSTNVNFICRLDNPLDVPECKDWKKTKGFIRDCNKCKTCGGTGEVNELEYNNSDPTKETFIAVDKIQEELAEYAHKQWSGWMEYLFNKCTLHEGTMIIPVWAVVRWQKQIKTSYKDLSEEEKISDRSEAEGMLNIFNAANLLPTEKVCPECGCSGTKNILENNKPTGWFEGCDKCHSIGTIPAYYTPEQYEKIMGKPYPEKALVWYKDGEYGIDPKEEFSTITYKGSCVMEASPWSTISYIVQTAQTAPPADYRPEK